MNPFTLTEVPDALSPEQCEQIIADYGARVAPSLVGSADARRSTPNRTSSSAKLPDDVLPERIVAALDAQLLMLTSYPPANRERWELVRYRVGEAFRTHHDVAWNAPRVERVWSVVLYLRQAAAGGETSFPRLKRVLSPPAGTMLLWRNFDPDGAGPVPVRESWHESRPVRDGEKWVLVTWVGAEPRKGSTL